MSEEVLIRARHALKYIGPKLGAALAVGQLTLPICQQLSTTVRSRRSYTVKVPSTDEIYNDLHEWILSLLPARQQRALVAWTTNIATSHGDRFSTPPLLHLRYDGSREQTLAIGRHKARVLVSEGDPAKGHERYGTPAEIVFTTSSLAAQRALLNQINEVMRQSHVKARKPALRMLNKWGEWQVIDNLAARQLDSIILPSGQVEQLVGDIATFLNSEADYARRGIPWHRGHIYHGPPGTGKTSVARAIANHFQMDIYYLSLADLSSDCNLLGMTANIAPRSMLLIEDADVFHAATERTEGDGATMSGLLNLLDGVATPHGLVTVLTTNNISDLDPALVRPGRVDVTEHFGYADADVASRILSRWYGESMPIVDVPAGVTPAHVVELCKRNRTPRSALEKLSIKSAEAVR